MKALRRLRDLAVVGPLPLAAVAICVTLACFAPARSGMSGDGGRRTGREADVPLRSLAKPESAGAVAMDIGEVPALVVARQLAREGQATGALRLALRAIEDGEARLRHSSAENRAPAATAALQDGYLLAIEILAEGGRSTAAFDLNERRLSRVLLQQIRGGSGRPKTLREIQRDIDPGTRLVSYALGQEGSIAWVVGQKSMESFRLPGRGVLESASRRAVGLLGRGARPEAQKQAEGALDELGKLIWDPLAPALGGKRLVIIAEGAVSDVPFAALPMPGLDPFQPLVGRYEIVTAPSASVWSLLRQRYAARESTEGRIGVIADPVYQQDDSRLGTGGPQAAAQLAERRTSRGTDFQRLLFARSEAQAVLELANDRPTRSWLGVEANRASFLSRAPERYKVLHFATHSSEAPGSDGAPALVLSRVDREGRPQRALLTSAEIERLEIRADLVVLSTCRSRTRSGDTAKSALSLEQSFLVAGSSNVIASLWNVDDRATAELMMRFYRGLLVENLTPAAALREAQLALSRQVPWRAPYYWAGFVLTGAGG